MTGTPALRGLPDDRLVVGQSELHIVTRAEKARPGVEELQSLSPCLRLGPKIAPDETGELVHQLSPEVRAPHHETLGDGEILAAAAFHRVAGEGEGGSAETDQRDTAAFQLPPGKPDGLEGEPGGLFDVGGGQSENVGFVSDRVVHDGALARLEAHFQAQSAQRREDIGEDDGGVQVERVDGLHGHLAAQLGLLDDLEHPVLLPEFPVLAHVASRLPHEPHRGPIDRLAPAGLQEARIVGICYASQRATSLAK